MQVDIFYQEISYERIEQNIAFEFLSFLSEIGGFLGLLLGASVLTVCELIDYVSLSFLNRVNIHKNNVHKINVMPADQRAWATNSTCQGPVVLT